MKSRAVQFSKESKLLRKIAVAAALILCVFTASSTAQDAGKSKDWPKGTPKEFGIDAAKLAAFDADIASGKYGLEDSMLILRCGTDLWRARQKRRPAESRHARPVQLLQHEFSSLL